MSATAAVFGWTNVRTPDRAAMLGRLGAIEVPDASSSETGEAFGVAVTGASAVAGLFRADGRLLALHGHPLWKEGSGARVLTIADVAQRFLARYAEAGAAALASLHGDFALALIDPARGRALLAVDRFGVRSLVYAPAAEGFIFGPTCDAVARHPDVRAEIDPQQIFNYVYFHMVPGPATPYRDLFRVPPGHYAELADGRIAVRTHWQPSFVEQLPRGADGLAHEFRDSIERAVRDAASGARCGTFLSGGTDSSTVTGFLGKVARAPAPAFSIGFDAAGFDEMEYARIASKHFGAEHHEYYVTPSDVVDAIPRIADAYDQPFGNASAVPTYYCARLARATGMQRILGGDGGDELFGGNARYAKQAQFARYENIPAPLRRRLIEPFTRALPGALPVPLLRKARSYITQAAMPMPDRTQSYNLLERLGAGDVFESAFLAGVDRGAPIAQLRTQYASADARSLVNRMLALDFKFTLADNDLPKVTRMCELAGIDVAFPMLDDDVVDLSLRVPPEGKLRGTRLRPFFKEALADFLPGAILAKQKHGFGLPVGAWLTSYAPLRALAGDALSSLRRRNIVRAEFIDRLQSRHVAEHAEYFGTMVWILMMLELWLARQRYGAVT